MLSMRSAIVVAALHLLLAGNAAIADDQPFKTNTTADHSKFKELQKDFASGPEVTKA